MENRPIPRNKQGEGFNTKEDMNTNMIEIKRVIFHDMPDFILSIGQWESIGGWKGFLKHNGVSINQVKKVETTKMPERKFFKLEPWEG